MHILRAFFLVMVTVNLRDQYVSASAYNESAIWNTFLQYASVVKELPSTGQTWKLPQELNWSHTSARLSRTSTVRNDNLDMKHTATATSRQQPYDPDTHTKGTPSTYRPYITITIPSTNKPYTSPITAGTTTRPSTPQITISASKPTTAPTTTTEPKTPTTPTLPPTRTTSKPTTAPTTTPTPETPTTRTTTQTTTPTPFTTPAPQPFTLPPYQNTAKMARFVVHFSNWGSLSYQAEQTEISGYPSVRVYSISDGYVYEGTGVPYFMVSPLDLTIQALDADERCSLIVSLSQTSYCNSQQWDPEDPRCVQVILTGRFVKLPKNSDEMMFARRVLWDRHPQMISWFVNKTDHNWQFAKLNIEFITVIDYFGGRKYPGLSEYFSAEAPKPYGVEMI